MNYLALGSVGPLVANMHRQLVSLGYKFDDGDINGARFGISTDAELRRFQSEHGLKSDGIAGPATLRELAHASSVASPKAPHGIEEVRRYYGDIRIGRVNGESVIVSPDGWEHRNMILVRDFPGVAPRSLYVNRKIEAPLRQALTDAQRDCPGYPIRTIGCFNPRMKRTSGQALSLHAWGAAVDINAAANPMRKPLTCDMPPKFVEAFKRAGFKWGAEFPTPDPQHWQYATGY